MNRYFIYCRKSTEDDDRQAISLEPQEIELTRFAAQHVLPVADVLLERKSARKPGRTQEIHPMSMKKATSCSEFFMKAVSGSFR
jgi:hypothetical protein